MGFNSGFKGLTGNLVNCVHFLVSTAERI